MYGAEEAFTFLDWGTGSGCIAITLLLEFPNASAIMAERSGAAIGYARRNVERHGVGGQASILNTETPEDIAVSGVCDMVISNPPYIPSGEIAELMREVRDHEPREALDGGAGGLDCYKALFGHAPRWLKPGGLMFLEMGSAGQTEALRRSNIGGWSFIREFPDSSGFPRCALWKHGA